MSTPGKLLYSSSLTKYIVLIAPYAVPTPILFKGNAEDQVEEFIRQIRAEAFQNGKSRDDEWIADFAGTCFAGNALWWYEGLELETQSSWKLLRQALVTKYGPKPDLEE